MNRERCLLAVALGLSIGQIGSSKALFRDRSGAMFAARPGGRGDRSRRLQVTRPICAAERRLSLAGNNGAVYGSLGRNQFPRPLAPGRSNAMRELPIRTPAAPAYGLAPAVAHGACRPKCLRIFSMTGASRIAAMMLTRQAAAGLDRLQMADCS